MAVRILYWNIENFAFNKIANPVTNKRQKGASRTMANAAIDRKDYITAHFTGLNVAPHIMVVVEVETGYDAPGRIVRGAGANGATTLLTEIRNSTGNPNWMLVPPLQTGPNEAVGVYYDSTSLVFTGPYVWPGGAGVVPQPAAVPGAYPPPFNTTINTGRNVPPGALYNVGIAENSCAASVTYTFNNNLAFLQGQPVPFFFQRAPYMVTFAELDNNNAVIANLTLFAVHSPANAFAAGMYLRDLANYEEITNANDNDEIRTIVGDFNVNLMSASTAMPPYAESGSYTPLQTENYNLELVPLAAPPAGPDGYPGYYATHIKRGSKSTYWDTAQKTDYYPGYGMIGSSLVQNFYAIDNIFTRYGAGLAPPANINFTIINGIVGSPYTLHGVPAAGTPQGSLNFNIRMASPAFAAPLANGPAFTVGRRSSFNAWDNYGFIRSTSDHLALVIDI